jgi:hypothetical protein
LLPRRLLAELGLSAHRCDTAADEAAHRRRAATDRLGNLRVGLVVEISHHQRGSLAIRQPAQQLPQQATIDNPVSETRRVSKLR